MSATSSSAKSLSLLAIPVDESNIKPLQSSTTILTDKEPSALLLPEALLGFVDLYSSWDLKKLDTDFGDGAVIVIHISLLPLILTLHPYLLLASPFYSTLSPGSIRSYYPINSG